MPKYRIEFYGTKRGSLGVGYATEHVVRVVESTSEEDAELRAYETHDHIHRPLGGWVSISEVGDGETVTESCRPIAGLFDCHRANPKVVGR